MKRKLYVKPEVVELGNAAKLTLGSNYCGVDGYCCKRAKDEDA